MAFRAQGTLGLIGKTHAIEITGTLKKPDAAALARLQQAAADDGNVFAELLAAVRVCSLGQISHALYEVGGQYRRGV